jgi:PIN domain nuclease of toxin-antitoxin system
VHERAPTIAGAAVECRANLASIACYEYGQRLLLDINALLWLLDDDGLLGSSARAAVRQAEALIVSVASLWEIAIIHKLDPIPQLYDAVRDLGFDRLDIADNYLLTLQRLPQLRRDPFGRLLISGAVVEQLTVLIAGDAFESSAVSIPDARR